jgi:peptidoglycan/xylan/chitin deacetylase (PgdA/CDA1 family)
MGAPLRHWLFRIGLTLAGVAVAAFALGAEASPWVRLAVLALAIGVAVQQASRYVPAFDPLGRIRWRLTTGGATKRCAITFDDGPSLATPAVLDILATEGVPATFFVLGDHVERHPHVVQRAHAEGHAIGIHGMDHSRLAGAPEAAVARQIGGVTGALERLGVSPAPVYRTPHGFKSRGVFAAAHRHRLTLWAWTRGIWDTDCPDPAVLVRRATRLARSRMVLLLHDGRGDEVQPDVGPMLAALPGILRELKRRGFVFVRLVDV